MKAKRLLMCLSISATSVNLAFYSQEPFKQKKKGQISVDMKCTAKLTWHLEDTHPQTNPKQTSQG